MVFDQIGNAWNNWQDQVQGSAIQSYVSADIADTSAINAVNAAMVNRANAETAARIRLYSNLQKIAIIVVIGTFLYLIVTKIWSKK